MVHRELDRTLRRTTRDADGHEVTTDLFWFVAELAGAASDDGSPRLADSSLPGEVVLPVLNLHVEAAVDLEDEYMAVGEVPLAVGPAHATGGVATGALTVRWPQTSPTTHPPNIDLCE